MTRGVAQANGLSATGPTDERTREELSRCEPRLRAFARRALGASDGVEDLVQDTLVAALAQSFEGRSSLSTWLIGILSHKVIDHLRRSRQPAGIPADAGEADLLEAPTRSPERALEQQQALEIIERTLPALPEHERLAVLMVDVEGLERPDVCNALQVEPTHLRVLLHRGRHRLRRALESAEL